MRLEVQSSSLADLRLSLFQLGKVGKDPNFEDRKGGIYLLDMGVARETEGSGRADRRPISEPKNPNSKTQRHFFDFRLLFRQPKARPPHTGTVSEQQASE